MAHRFLQLNTSKRIRDIQFTHLPELDRLYSRALEFYRLVKERDIHMTKNIVKRLKESGAEKAVIITGGFHSKPFEDFFTSRGYSYALLSPKITVGEDAAGRKAYIESILQNSASSSSTYEAPSLAHHLKQRAKIFSNPQWALRSELRSIRNHLKPGAPDLTDLMGDLNSGPHAQALGYQASENENQIVFRSEARSASPRLRRTAERPSSPEANPPQAEKPAEFDGESGRSRSEARAKRRIKASQLRTFEDLILFIEKSSLSNSDGKEKILQALYRAKELKDKAESPTPIDDAKLITAQLNRAVSELPSEVSNDESPDIFTTPPRILS
jgi:hypothetical protein